MSDEYLEQLERFTQTIGITFKDMSVLRTAFTHRSYVNEYRGEPITHNERLEFLGDAVLELVVTDFLYRRYPDKTEGDLTAYRAALVNTVTIGQAGADLNMNSLLLLSKGESRDTGRARQYILANTFEAVIGAIYLDQGYDAAQNFIAANLFPKVDDIVAKRLWQDSKSLFQERAQDRVSITPNYVIVEEDGPDHDKRFTVAACLGEEQVALGTGKSKQEAEQAAATNALQAKEWTE
jgi:ribonuclease-3